MTGAVLITCVHDFVQCIENLGKWAVGFDLDDE